MDYSHHNTGMNTATTTATNTRPGSLESDPIEIAAPRNPFASPYGSMPASTRGSSTGLQSQQPPRYFHSRRIKKGEQERPWLDRKDPKEKWVTIIPIIGVVIGIALTGFLVYEGLASVQNYVYCPVYIADDFSNGLDTSVWTKEVEVGGYGNGEFEWTTNTDENVYTEDGILYIKPTLTDADLIEKDNVVNLLKDGTCSGTTWTECVAVTNTTNGTIVNPVKSGRISTKKGASIRFGKVEVEAKLPAGDWLWPAIWMLPTKNVYGAWPASGEIDIMESRGNNYTYPQGGDNIISSTLHWGPDSANDGWYRDNEKRKALHTTYADEYNTFGVEWSTKYIFTYVNTRLVQVMYVSFDKPFWEKGDFSTATSNDTVLVDPWVDGAVPDATPFDQDFYLIINVAVGGTNGWFEDNVASKPWVDASSTAKKEFWTARDEWYPTWEKNGVMAVKSVKMWQQAGWNGCE